ncbi:putative membrane protein F35D11,3 [Rhizoctonia solani AG-1 IB]|uniref:Putative membrane protein F35D11,3 n=1 Tax=Thanatephorus cucumeris (strain AG1-IB / isolate 7/3/14) TaxID=1108050 RepID=M5BX20_THACB|nr:putative membrane protein F35D11,3 [Rhizoctonia solani AG-1 IB]
MSELQTKDVLSEELRFTVAVVAKAAIANPPDHLRAPALSSDDEPGEVVEWWPDAGELWLQGVCAHLNIEYRTLPLQLSVSDARSLAGPITNEDYHKIVSTLLTATILPSPRVKEEAIMRSSNAKASEVVARALGYTTASQVEESLGRDLFKELKEAEMKEKSEAARKEQEHGWGGKWARWAATGSGVILGGVALGLTGGLAAPVLLPFLPFLSASSAPIVLGYLFGVAGGGLTGSRVRERWGGVEYFEFKQIAGSNEDSMDPEKLPYAVYRRKGTTRSNTSPATENRQQSHEEKQVPPSLVATICIPGLAVDTEDEGVRAYKHAFTTTFAKHNRDVFVLKHSPDVMLTTGQTLNTWITDKLLTGAGKEVLAQTAFNAVLAAVSLPMRIYTVAGFALDNHWIRASDKARKAGSILSEVLKEKVQGERPVTMVGSSLGALALFRALTVLAESHEVKGPLVDSVFLISLPQVVSPQEWAKVRKVVGRRIVNVYSSQDFVLASVGRLHEVVSGAGFGDMAGLNQVNVHGVEDVEMSEIVGAVVCKAALVNPPDDLRAPPEGPSGQLGDAVGWRKRDGQVWLQHVCAHLAIDHQILPPEPSILDAESLTGPISHSDYHKITSTLLAATILPSPKAKEEANERSNDGKPSEKVARAFGYTAASRAFLAQTLELLSIPIKVLLEVEKALGHDLFEELKEAEMKEKSEAARKEQEHGWGGKWGRWAATGGGVILGGVAIGLTGGLAAPALLPLLPFLTASTAPIVLGSLFGVAGGGLAGNRVRKRWGGVERFEFEQIAGGNHDSAVHKKASYDVYQHKGRTNEAEGTSENQDGRGEGKPAPPSLVATICVPGIVLGSEDEGLYAYKDALANTLANPIRDVFVLKHSPDVMLSTGETLNTWIRNKILTKAGKEVLARTAFNAVMAAVALPLTIYSTTGLALDNDWIRACDKAKKAGNLLSEVLKEKVQGERPLSMVGSSLGALALFKALVVLADSEELKEPLIDSVFFISLPQVVSPREWTKVRRVIGRRIVNVYSSRDLVLASVGRLHEVFSGAGFGGMAGLNAVSVHGVEDIDISEIVGGHFDINSNMTKILEIIGVNN